MTTTTIKTAYVTGFLTALAALAIFGTAAHAETETASSEPAPILEALEETTPAPEIIDEAEPETQEAPQETPAAPEEDPQPAPAEEAPQEAENGPETEPEPETQPEPEEEPVPEPEPAEEPQTDGQTETAPAPVLDAWNRPSVYPAALAVTAAEPGPGDAWTVTARTATGIEYAFYMIDAADLARGDLLAVLMDDAGTPGSVFDDMVIYAAYAGPAAW